MRSEPFASSKRPTGMRWSCVALVLILSLGACASANDESAPDPNEPAGPLVVSTVDEPPPTTPAMSTVPTTTSEPSAPVPAIGGGVDGPVMFDAKPEPGPRESQAAEIGGVLELDGDCLFFAAEYGRFPVLWPWGTTWNDGVGSVTLPDGQSYPLGSEFSGGGGYFDEELFEFKMESAEVRALALRCVEGEFREIAHVQSY